MPTPSPVSLRPSAFTIDPQPVRRWSLQQEDIIRWFLEGQGNAAVRARAGTGKTTIIVEGIKVAPEQRILMCAFNKSIADELAERITNPNAEAATLHGVGFRCVNRFWERTRVDATNRAINLARKVCGAKLPDAIVRLVAKLHTKGREMEPYATSGEQLNDLAVAFDLAPDPEWVRAGYSLGVICELAVKAMDLAADERPAEGIDFADMLFLPIRNKWLVPMYDLVVVDEAQDMNATQLEIARGVLRPGGRMIVVGDDRQAIYGFRGADTGALDRLKQELQAVELPLTTTYRCGRLIVASAKRLVPDYAAPESAHEGAVREIDFEKLLEQVQPSDYVLSRTNAPLVSVAMSMIRAGRRARIQGKDIGAGLKAIAKKLATGTAANSVPEWLKKLTAWQERECDRAEKAKLPGKVDQILDQAMTLKVLAEGVASVREIETRIDLLFSVGSNVGFVICSSIHRAKGLEADRVFILHDTLYPPVSCVCGHRHMFGKDHCPKCACVKYDADSKKLTEEQNIEYVAITRARQELVWVEGLGS